MTTTPAYFGQKVFKYLKDLLAKRGAPEVAMPEERLPDVLALEAVIPNPICGSARFAFALPRSGRVDLSVFDVAGRRVARVLSGDRSAGRYDILWEARDSRGVRLPAGVYFLRLEAEGEAHARKVVLLRGN